MSNLTNATNFVEVYDINIFTYFILFSVTRNFILNYKNCNRDLALESCDSAQNEARYFGDQGARNFWKICRNFHYFIDIGRHIAKTCCTVISE